MKRGNLPVKRSINLAATEEKAVNFKVGIPAIILIILAAFAFGKFAVADRLVAVSRAEAQAAALQTELNAAYDKLNSFGELTEIYAHYTYSGMTKDEISRADRGSAIELLRRIVLPSGQVSSWTLSGNVLTVNIYCDDLRVVNRTVQNIEADDHVNFCTVNTAATTDRNNYGYTDGGVTARITIYLNPNEEVTRP
ncbi:MAG: hypothetical protein IKS55_13085 [Oscillospiraceae bacterium]|nr:hypothetical protein [Oscillospiraceae bacterium]